MEKICVDWSWIDGRCIAKGKRLSIVVSNPLHIICTLSLRKKSEAKMGLEHTHLAEMRTRTLVLLPT